MEITNKYISELIDDLYNTIGLRKPIAYKPLIAMLKKQKTSDVVNMVKDYFNLPVKLEIEYTTNFQTKSLALEHSYFVEEISAQVLIPPFIPMYGTDELANTVINIKISPYCWKHPYLFLVILSHELSHILMYSLNYHRKENEIATDLTAIMLGFVDLYKIAFKKTYKQGYLSYKQFVFAHKKVNALIKDRSRKRYFLLSIVRKINTF